jgi:amino acid efflux transporter
MSEKKLSLLGGTSYAIGSIIGSGILFLPSLTYKLSGSDVFLSWLLATLICIPLLVIFYDMSKNSSSDEGIKGFIEQGLGKDVSACFPILMLSTVAIGMPSSALIVGKFVNDYVGREGLEYPVAFYILLFGFVSNLMGKEFGEKVQKMVSLAFLAVGVALFILTIKSASTGYAKLIPSFNLVQTFSGITMAFWAFAGFENLTFIIQDFRDPRRDFFLSMVIALIVCGLLYLGITANYAAIIPYSEVETVMGLFQLSKLVEPRALSGLVIVVLSLFALKTNFNSWIRGLTSMIKTSAQRGHLPTRFQNGHGPLFLLGSLFFASLVVSYVFPSFLETGLIIVSSNFVVMYLLCTLSYLKTNRSCPKLFMALFVLVFLIFSLFTSREKLIYPFLVMGASYLFHKLKPRSVIGYVGLLFILSPLTSFAAPREVNIALIFRLNDKFNETTKNLVKGIELAKAVYEKEGKFKINLSEYSHDEKLVTVVEAATKAIKDGHKIIIGGENSDEAMAIADAIAGKDVVLLTPTATNPRVTAGRPHVFRTCVSDDKVADKLAEFAFSSLKATRIGVLHNVSYPYSDFLSKRFAYKVQEFIDGSTASKNQRPIVVVQKVVRNQNDYSKEIKFFKEQGITHLALLSFQSDLLRFNSQALLEGLNPVYLGSDGWGLNETVQKQIAKEVKGYLSFTGFRNVYWHHGNSNSANTNFKKNYLARYKEEANGWAAITYDTVTVILESVSKIHGQLTGKSMQTALSAYKGYNLLTTDKFSFDNNNTPSQNVFIYKINNQSIGFYGKI